MTDDGGAKGRDVARDIARAPRGGRWAIAMVAVTLACLVAPILVLRGAIRDVKDAGGAAAEAVTASLERVAAAFAKGTIETSLRSYASELKGVSRLQFAELKQGESFERKDAKSVAWGSISLPDVVVEARAQVTYAYTVDLQKKWTVVVRDGRVEVEAPAPEPSAPALDPSSLEFVVRQGSVLRDEEAVKESLRAGLGSLLQERARDHLGLVRETGRKAVADFLRAWLLARYADAREFDVVVRFADEPAVSGRAPTVRTPSTGRDPGAASTAPTGPKRRVRTRDRRRTASRTTSRP